MYVCGCNVADEDVEVKGLDVLGQPVPSAIPSPELRPAQHHARDLIQLESPQGTSITIVFIQTIISDFYDAPQYFPFIFHCIKGTYCTN